MVIGREGVWSCIEKSLHKPLFTRFVKDLGRCCLSYNLFFFFDNFHDNLTKIMLVARRGLWQ